MGDVENWHADMDAWGLDDMQQVHHLHRLREYHLGQLDHALERSKPTDRHLVAWELLFLVSLAVTVWVLLR